jgi:hypothetical protein
VSDRQQTADDTRRRRRQQRDSEFAMSSQRLILRLRLLRSLPPTRFAAVVASRSSSCCDRVDHRRRLRRRRRLVGSTSTSDATCRVDVEPQTSRFDEFGSSSVQRSGSGSAVRPSTLLQWGVLTGTRRRRRRRTRGAVEAQWANGTSADQISRVQISAVECRHGTGRYGTVRPCEDSIRFDSSSSGAAQSRGGAEAELR